MAIEQDASIDSIFGENEPNGEVQSQETEEVETEIETEVETEEGQEADEEEGETLELETVAQYFGIDADKLDVDENGGVVFKTKIDGVEGVAKPADLIKSYQLEGHLNKKNMEVVERAKALEAEKTKLQDEFKSKLDQLDTFANIAAQELQNEYNNIDWKELKEYDPGQYAAKQLEYQQRSQRLAGLYEQSKAKREELLKQAEAEKEKRLTGEAEKILQAFPEWEDSDLARAEHSKLMDYAKNTGFSDGEVKEIYDHRALVILSKAMKYDALQQKEVKLKHRLKKVPVVAKSGGNKQKETKPKQKEAWELFYT